MKAIFALVLALVAISDTLAQDQCEISYYSYAPPPTCDATGCSDVGSAAYAAVLDASSPSFSVSMGISEIGWSGNCLCRLQLWSGPGQTGRTPRAYRFPGDSGDVMTSSIWSRRNQSFRVTCSF